MFKLYSAALALSLLLPLNPACRSTSSHTASLALTGANRIVSTPLDRNLIMINRSRTPNDKAGTLVKFKGNADRAQQQNHTLVDTPGDAWAGYGNYFSPDISIPSFGPTMTVAQLKKGIPVLEIERNPSHAALMAAVHSDAAVLAYDYFPTYMPSAEDDTSTYDKAFVVRDLSAIEDVWVFDLRDQGVRATQALAKPSDWLGAFQLFSAGDRQFFDELQARYCSSGTPWTRPQLESADMLFWLLNPKTNTAYATLAADAPSDLAAPRQALYTALEASFVARRQGSSSSDSLSSDALQAARQLNLIAPDQQPATLADLATMALATVQQNNPEQINIIKSYVEVFSDMMQGLVDNSIAQIDAPPRASSAKGGKTPNDSPDAKRSGEGQSSDGQAGKQGTDPKRAVH